MNTTVSIYNNKYDSVNQTTIDLLQELPVLISTSGSIIAEKIEFLRQTLDEDSKIQVKGSLPMFTCAGTFFKRDASCLLQYSSFVMLDFDHITTDYRRQQLKSSFIHLPYVAMLFESPNRGLKVCVYHNNTQPALHKALFQQLHAVKEFNVPEFDISCSDICRGTFVSYDPQIYINRTPIPFVFNPSAVQLPPMQSNYTPRTSIAVPSNVNLTALVNNFNDGWADNQILNYLNNHFWKHHPEDYQPGYRKTSCLKKAGKLCVYGASYTAALQELKYRYCYRGLAEAEVQEVVDYAYSHNGFGSQREQLKSINRSLESVFRDALKK